MLPPSTLAGACVGVGPPKPGMGVPLGLLGKMGLGGRGFGCLLKLPRPVGAVEAHGDVSRMEPHPGGGVRPLEHVVHAVGE